MRCKTIFHPTERWLRCAVAATCARNERVAENAVECRFSESSMNMPSTFRPRSCTVVDWPLRTCMASYLTCGNVTGNNDGIQLRLISTKSPFRMPSIKKNDLAQQFRAAREKKRKDITVKQKRCHNQRLTCNESWCRVSPTENGCAGLVKLSSKRT